MAINGDNRDAPAQGGNPLGETSFQGRLQLKDFLFTGSSNGPATRRSPRLLASQPAASSPSPAPEALSKSRKRKADHRTPDVEESSGGRSKTSTPVKPSTSTSIPASFSASASPSPKKRPRQASSYAPPSTYAHLPHLPDAIAPNLLILFIGLNPGLQTARSGHAYAHPSNLFWKLLFSSGITPTRCRAQDDQDMPRRYALGHTNIVARPSRNGAELSKAEMDEGVAALEDKCRRWRPEVACIVGKSIWESVFRVRHGRAMRKDEFEYGWQEERMGVVKGGDGEGEPWEGSRIFVATSTSGLAATLRPAEKERIWKILGDWCVERRKERKDAAGAGVAAEENAEVSKALDEA